MKKVWTGWVRIGEGRMKGQILYFDSEKQADESETYIKVEVKEQ